jgi:glycosyltransferase involved in cell wall biosynthesis
MAIERLNSPLITTIITTYRRPELLKRAVESVLNQTYPHLQVCVYDNASGDSTREMMQDFMKRDSRVKYHCHAENIGMMPNYQYAFSQIETPFYSFLSDDDCFLPGFYETALKGFKEFPEAAFSACGSMLVDKNNQFLADHLSSWQKDGYCLPSETLFEMFTHRRFPIPLGVLFQTEKVKDIRPDFSSNIQLLWDVDYLVRIALRHPVVINKTICGLFLVHDHSFSFSFSQEGISGDRGLEVYLKGYQQILNRIIECKTLPINFKRQIRKLFIGMLRYEISFSVLLRCIQQKQLKKAISAIRLFQSFYGIDGFLPLYFLALLIKVYVPVAWSLMKKGRDAFRFLKSSIKKDTH